MATTNAVTIKAGTYVAVSDFASADVADLSIFGINFSLMFISNGTTFDGINIQTSAMGIPYLYYGSTLTFSTSWQNEAYKTVVLETDQGTSNDFADWFTACFTLQEQPSITDLTGTTWHIPSGWTATAGYGKFNVNCSNDYGEGNGFYIGYYDAQGMGDVVATADKVGIYQSGIPIYTPSSTVSFTFAITDGTDTTNTSLIEWLETNGELQEEPTTTDTVTITYGDRTITLTAGQKCTFKGGKVMQADIVATVSASEETEDELQGTWVFNDSVTVDVVQMVSYSFEFTSKNTAFIKLSTQIDGRIFYFTTDSSSITVMNDYGVWNDNDYKTINITSKLSEVENGDTLLTWLKANATKQGEVALISFTVAGTEYKAVEGMTWTEWCDSEYNTDGYYIDGTFVRPIAGIVVTNANSNIVSPSSTIINGYAYSRAGAGGAD